MDRAAVQANSDKADEEDQRKEARDRSRNFEIRQPKSTCVKDAANRTSLNREQQDDGQRHDSDTGRGVGFGRQQQDEALFGDMGRCVCRYQQRQLDDQDPVPQSHDDLDGLRGLP